MSDIVLTPEATPAGTAGKVIIFVKSGNAKIHTVDAANLEVEYTRIVTGKTVAPTVNDDSGDGYMVGDMWIDETANKGYLAVDVTVGAAVWKEVAAAAGAGDMLAATYDPTSVAADAFDVDNHVDGTTNKVYSATDKSKLAGIAANANNYAHPNHSGEVTSVGDGAQTIAANAVTLAKLATQASDTILANITNGAAVPTAVALAANKFLAKSSSGNIAAKDITDFALTLLDDANAAAVIATLGALAEYLTLAPADGTATGIKITATVDTNAEGIGAPLTLAADGHWDTSDANAAGRFPCQGMALETGTGTKKILLYGTITNNAWNWTPAAGAGNLLYLSITVGTISQSLPTAEDDVVQVIGFVLSTDTIFFNPSQDHMTRIAA
jgi:hypothetical protein